MKKVPEKYEWCIFRNCEQRSIEFFQYSSVLLVRLAAQVS